MLKVLSPAKINLYLKVVGKREDGYHELVTVMHELKLADELSFEESEALSLSVDGRELPTDGRNLVIRAADLLMKECGVKRGARIMLNKRIPVGGGLGGGSSNCAATLKALNGLWNLSLSNNDLMALGAKLGSDVCFFLVGGAALCRGRGEIVTKIPAAGGIKYLLIVPPFSCSTTDVYRNLNFGLTSGQEIVHDVEGLLEKGSVEKLTELVYNELWQSVCSLYPRLEELRHNISGILGRPVHLSGSGSTLYVLLDCGSVVEERIKELKGTINAEFLLTEGVESEP